MFRVLITVEVKHVKNCLRFILKMPNCAAVGCTNRSTKNPNLIFHEYMLSGCKILRGKSVFQRTSISVPSILKKKLFRKRFEDKCDYSFSLCCNSSSHLQTFFKNISRFSVKKVCKVVFK